jgi:hypothetical protein
MWRREGPPPVARRGDSQEYGDDPRDFANRKSIQAASEAPEGPVLDT